MEQLTNFILNDSAEFTPEVLIRYMIFVLILSCIGSIVRDILSVGK